MPTRFATDDPVQVRPMLLKHLGGNETLYDYCKAQATPAGVNPYNLTEDERLAIWLYSAKQLDLYRTVNAELWSGRVSTEVLFFSQLLADALSKLPRHNGLAYRGYRAPDLTNFLSLYDDGGVVQWHGFSSSSLVIENAYPGNVLFTIKSQNGRILGDYADYPPDHEVLFLDGSRYRVIATERRGDFAVVELDEIR